MKLTKEELLFINRTLADNSNNQPLLSDKNRDRTQQTHEEIKKLLASISSHSQFSIVAKSDHEQVEFPLNDLSTLIDLLENSTEAPNILEATQTGTARSWRTCPSTPVRLRLSTHLMPFNMVSISQSGGLLNTFPYQASAIQIRLISRIAKLYLADPMPLFANVHSIKVASPLELAISFAMNKADNEKLKAFILHNYVQRKGIG
ncbi:hypothetical protein [Pseudoalteromonas piscicida]|uniref:PilZ domain-containing protein n=1 Tax=Pseudoalteromonas piscicida TaxID=43662 RepID=A0A2A5JTQ5_PSEO7|nr:hypothetical protein [Pseudoalteromonas piscicida]PCK32798.1 hypothetical protein CEX98_05220 [Pseudoalteromonas piscicida]